MDLKQLKATLKIMRDNGVLHLKTADIELQLDHQALFPNKEIQVDESEDKYANFPGEILSPEQLAFYSSGGLPESKDN